jgi:hypothetical protein
LYVKPYSFCCEYKDNTFWCLDPRILDEDGKKKKISYHGIAEMLKQKYIHNRHLDISCRNRDFIL